MITSNQRERLLAAINYQPTNPPMPHLTPAEIQVLRELVDAGREVDAWAELSYKGRVAVDNAMETLLRKNRELETRSMEDKEHKARMGIIVAPAMTKAAHGATVNTSSKANDEPQGKMPRTEAGKLTVEAAWEIERETLKKTTAEIVMEKLQLWAKEIPNNHPALIKSIPYGVVWATKKERKEKDYMIEDCGRHLTEWYKSRN